MRTSNYVLLLLILSPLLSFALFETSSNFQELDNFKQITEVITGSDFLSCFFFYNTFDCPKCTAAEKVIDSFSDDMAGVMKFYHVDCDKIWDDATTHENFPICNPKLVSNLPQMTFYMPPPQRFEEDGNKQALPKEFVYTGPVTVKDLSKFAKDKLPNFRQLITTQGELDYMLSFTTIPNKFILFTDKSETPTLFRGLTSEFRERIEFAEIRKGENTKETFKKYGIKRSPVLLLLRLNNDGSYERIVYDGKIHFDAVREFLKPYASERRVLRPGDRPRLPEDDDPVPSEITAEKFEEEVLKQDGYFAVHFHKEGQPHPAWNSTIQHLDHLFRYHNFSVESEEAAAFAKKNLGIKSFPSIKLYSYFAKDKKDGKYLYGPKKVWDNMIKDLAFEADDITQILSVESVRAYVADILKEHATPVIFFSSDEESEETYLYKAYALMARFNGRLRFARFKNPTQPILDLMSVKRNPGIIAVLGKGVEDHQVAHLNANLTSKSMRQFLSDVVARSIQKQPNQPDIVEIDNQDEFEVRCGDNYDFAFLAFLDGVNAYERQDKRFKNHMSAVKKAQEKFADRRDISISWVNAACFRDLLGRMGLNKKPSFVAYNAKTHRFVALSGGFSPENIIKFVEQVISKHLTLSEEPSEELDFDAKNCKEFVKKVRVEEDHRRESLKQYEQKKKQEEDELEKRRKREEEENLKDFQAPSDDFIREEKAQQDGSAPSYPKDEEVRTKSDEDEDDEEAVKVTSTRRGKQEDL